MAGIVPTTNLYLPVVKVQTQTRIYIYPFFTILVEGKDVRCRQRLTHPGFDCDSTRYVSHGGSPSKPKTRKAKTTL